MVRLEVRPIYRTPECLRVFQFHYGTIRRQIGTTGECIGSHFNSTMVRLEVENPNKVAAMNILISIPLWYD